MDIFPCNTGENSSATPNSGSHPSSQSRSGAPVTGGTTATMTVTSPAWSGTSWTGGMAYGCTAALKTTGTGGKILPIGYSIKSTL